MIATPTIEVEIWTGATDCLPSERPALVPELFASPDLSVDENGIAHISSYGLLGPEQWLKLAATINEAMAINPSALLLRISSRSQDSRGCGVAFIALEDATRQMPTVVHVEGGGAYGAALALGSFARQMFCDSDDIRIGGLRAKVAYGKPTRETKLLAADIGKSLRLLASRRHMNLGNEDYARAIAFLVHAGSLSRMRAENVLRHLNYVGAGR